MLRIEKAVLCAFLVACVAMTASGFSVFSAKCGEVRQQVFRLHILANSDSAEDQALKLKVRDRILQESDRLFATAGGKTEAIDTARRNLTEIESIAQDEVAKQGGDYPVKASIVNMYFNTRTYGDVTLPAGDYDALRITIGAAKGHNWWCVMFPPLCLPSAEGEKKLDDVLGADSSIVKEDESNPPVVIKFKTVEIIEKARDSIRQFLTRGKKKA